eukprot:10197963-Ditylum_brightwellii.AAC.1
MDNGPEQKQIQQKRFTYRWRLTFPAPENEDITPRKILAIDCVKHMVCQQLLARAIKWQRPTISEK